MSRIRVLPEAVASRIAAGEVIERPASVVKELVENALDADARRVDVVLEDGGKRIIRVSDDGRGMDRDDALLAFSQHATSKLGADFDFTRLTSFGFRGEALPAIASCSKVTLVTAEADGLGTRVRIENGRIGDVSGIGAPRGTSVEVTALFGAIPARRKFLRTPATELSHVVRYLEQQALSRPDVHFTLAAGRPLLQLPPVADAAARVAQVLGEEFVREAVSIDAGAGDLRVRCWLARSRAGVGRVAQVTLLVNGRSVVDRTLSHALREASSVLFGVEEAPAGVLLLDLAPEDVDVNVHPSKREVRFARPWQVHDAVRDLIRGEVFARGSFGPALDVSDSPRLASVVAERGPTAAEGDQDRERWAVPAEPLLPGAVARERSRPYEAPSRATPMPRGWRILGQHRNTYILAEDEQGLVLVDQHAAHERILYERIMDDLGRAPPRQALLEPVVVELPASVAARLSECLPELLALGLEVEPFGEGAFAVRTVPAAAGGADPAELLRELASQDLPASRPAERIERLAATVACKAAVKAGFPLGHERMRFIAEELWQARVPTTCPHGRVALLRISDRDLDHRFGRI